jgi:hypothetical protein
MRYIKPTYFLVIAGLFLITSCQKVISLKLSDAAPQIVIEANLTNVYGVQYVTITRSVPFTNTNAFPAVSGASVVITDSSGYVYKFGEDTAGLYSYYPMTGYPGHKYTITVKTGGQTYTASSAMPQLVTLDSITAKIGSFGNNNLRTIVVNYQDPPNEANQYLFILTVNKEQAGTIFVNDDSFTNGKYVRDYLLQNGADINYHDTVGVEMQCIDHNMYEYWYSLSEQQSNGPGGGTTPSNPPSSFNNNALGYFSAHTTQSKAIIVN